MIKTVFLFSIFLIGTLYASANDPLACEICTLGLTAAQKLVQSNASQAEVILLMEKEICSRLGTNNASCVQFMETTGAYIVSLLADNVDPTIVCKKVKLCNSFAKWQSEQATPAECSICQLVLNTLEKFVVQNTSQAEVSKILDLICNKVLPETIRDECVSFVNQYEPIIITLLASQVDPNKVCGFVGLCNKTRTLEQTKPQVQVSSRLDPRSLNCTICKLVMMEVQTQLKSNASEQQIIHFMESKLCSLAGPLAPLCKIALESFGPQILTQLANGVDPEKVCEFLQMCSASKHRNENRPLKSIKQVKETVYCEICLYAAQFVDSYLSSNKTDQEISNDIIKICNLFPSPIKDECASFLGEYAPYVIELVAQDLDPKAVCSRLNLCSNFLRKK